MMPHMPLSPFERIHNIVARIPAGKVATYGQISRMLDGRYSAQFVGWAMHSAPDLGDYNPAKQRNSSQDQNALGQDMGAGCLIQPLDQGRFGGIAAYFSRGRRRNGFFLLCRCKSGLL